MGKFYIESFNCWYSLSTRFTDRLYGSTINLRGLFFLSLGYLLIMLTHSAQQYAFVIAFTLIAVEYIVFMLNFASLSLLHSKAALGYWGRWRWNRPCDQRLGRFLKSCRPVCLYAGQFHVLDRMRAPVLIRFCLQRAFFLVVQSRAG